MSWLPILPLLGVWILVVVAPGPDFLIVLRHAAGGSRRSGVRTAAGVVTGIGVWAVAGLFGVTVLVQRFEWLYTAARVAGALFLVALGVATIRATRKRSSRADGDEPPAVAAQRPGRLREWRAGLLTNLANPKALVFFGALFASLLPHHANLAMRAVTLGSMLAIAFAWFAAVAFLAGSPWITRGYRRLGKRLDLLTGGLFVGMGALLLPR
ncbi:LysE family translocator [Microbispora cellulosiformans]|uniref:LysE family translocator n=1 Tax=Microbispora cellulosiformans TaxID=2614688 RepID=A0A5J5KCU2_9ACTN|nr:LysE family transporter [Microbispora cellulosiformans]KAA9381704.1 LysE family translocator [Microbispora cellulosiformans]